MGRRENLLAALPLVLIVALGAALRISQFDQSLFEDEIWSWVGANSSFSGMYDWVRSDEEITPPIFTTLAWMSAKLGDPSTLVRLPSLLAGIATIPLVYAIALRTLGRRVALTAALLAALSPFLAFYAVEARAYALAAALVAVTTLAMLIAVDAERPRLWWFVYGAFSCAAMLTHYTSLYVLVAQFAWIVLFVPGARRPALIANVGAAAVFLLWLPGFLEDLDSPSRTFIGLLAPFSFTVFHTFTANFAFGYPGVGLETFYGIGFESVLLVGLAVATVGAIISLRRRRSREGTAESAIDEVTTADRRRSILLFVTLALAAPIGLTLVSVLGNDQYFPRNLAVSAPGLVIALAALLNAGPPKARIVALSFVMGIFAVGAIKTLEPQWHRADVGAAARVIEAEVGPEDVVIDAVWFGGVPPGDGHIPPLIQTYEANSSGATPSVDAISQAEIEGALQQARGHDLWLVGNPSLIDSVLGLLQMGDREPSFQQSFEGVLPTTVESYPIPAEPEAAG